MAAALNIAGGRLGVTLGLPMVALAIGDNCITNIYRATLMQRVAMLLKLSTPRLHIVPFTELITLNPSSSC